MVSATPVTNSEVNPELLYNSEEPTSIFSSWMQEACNASNVVEANAMSLATADAKGRPHVRYVLLKEFKPEEAKFVWYTNYDSDKGKQLEQNPKASLLFFWSALERQVRIIGKVSKVSAEESTEYYHVRPRGAQLGAWSSDQSSKIADQQGLHDKYEAAEARFSDKEVIERPPQWGGYQLHAESIEFWSAQSNYFHDRILFKRDGNQWTRQILQP